MCNKVLSPENIQASQSSQRQRRAAGVQDIAGRAATRLDACPPVHTAGQGSAGSPGPHAHTTGPGAVHRLAQQSGQSWSVLPSHLVQAHAASHRGHGLCHPGLYTNKFQWCLQVSTEFGAGAKHCHGSADLRVLCFAAIHIVASCFFIFSLWYDHDFKGCLCMLLTCTLLLTQTGFSSHSAIPEVSNKCVFFVICVLLTPNGSPVVP